MKKVVSIILIMTLVMGLSMTTAGAAATTSVAPVVHLTFDGDLKDSSGNGYNGSAPDANITYIDGNIGKAAKVDSAMITLAGSSAIDLNKEFSFSTWVRYDSGVYSGEILSRETVDDGRYQVGIYASYGDTGVTSSGLFEDLNDATYAQEQTYYSSGSFDEAQNKERFMHVVVVYNGSTYKLYIDGKLNSTTTVDAGTTNGNFFGNGRDFVVGGKDSASFFHGYMDDLYIFDKAITFADVTALYNAGVKTASNKIVVKVYDPYMMVNGTKKEIDPGKGTAPIINEQGRTILPIRAIIEEMGGKIAWDSATKCATITRGSNTIKLWINKDKAEVNGVLKEIDPGKGVVPELINNRTMLPIRFILKELGLPELVWDGVQQTITLQY